MGPTAGQPGRGPQGCCSGGRGRPPAWLLRAGCPLSPVRLLGVGPSSFMLPAGRTSVTLDRSRSVPGVGADISAWKPSLGPRMRDIRPWGETVPPRGSTSPLDPLPLTSQGKYTNLDIGVLATVSPSEKKRFLHSAFTQRRFPPFIGCLLLFLKKIDCYFFFQFGSKLK